MTELLRWLFSEDGFMPHGHCYTWDTRIVLLHALSDALIALAYTSIPVTLVYIVRKRRDLPFNWMFFCFGAFIIACGATHAMEVWTLWEPRYWLSGSLKAVTAAVSLATAALLVRLVPTILAIPSPEALRASEARLSRVLAAAHDPIVVADQTGRIRVWNDAAERMFGYAAGEVLGQPIGKLMPDLSSGAAPLAGKTTELTGRRKDGRELPLELSLSMAASEPETMFTGVLRDITERKRQEDELRQASRLKSEFLANMSHELRTPLNAIMGFSQLMRDKIVGPERHEECLSNVLTSSKHLLQLINDVLDLSKVEAGKLELKPEPVDLPGLVEEVCTDLRSVAAEKEIRLECEVAPELVSVVTDAVRLKQILYNLLSNAMKFTPRAGRVQVRIGPDGPERYRLAVEDTGIGIRPEDRGRLFVAFQQLDASSTKEHPGTGLGLALTKRLVGALGGEIGVESTFGKGSTFFAVLPRGGPPAS